MSNLKKVLFEEYGGFADKRIKKLENGSRFVVDDRADRDFGADRKLYPWFCEILVDVPSSEGNVFDFTLGKIEADEVVVTLCNVPESAGVLKWANQNGADYSPSISRVLTFDIVKRRQSVLNELATTIRSIVAPGAPSYSVPSYKYVCPRTADSLIRLRRTLDKAWVSYPNLRLSQQIGT